MIGVAAIYAVTSSLGKVAITHSSPLFFGATYFTALFIGFTPLALGRAGGGVRAVDRPLVRAAVAPGLFYAVMILAHTVALGLANVAYMIAVKRTSLLMAVAYGYFMFREERVADRLAGALLMFGGFVLVVTAR